MKRRRPGFCLRHATLALSVYLLAGGAGANDALDVELEGGMLGRTFRYTDPLSERQPEFAGLRPVDNLSPATPALRLRVQSYPLAPLTSAWPAQVGLHVDLQGGLPTNVRGGPDEAVRGHHSQGQLLLGGQVRIPLWAVECVPRVAWGVHGWTLAPADGSAPAFPDLTYEFVEAGLHARGVVEALVLEADFAWRVGLSAGEVASAAWFPNTSLRGMTAGVAAGWAFHPALELRAHLEFVRYGLSFHPDPSGPPERVVGGATDQSVLVTLGLRWRLPGRAD